MLYRDITKPHLWPVATLIEAAKECRQHLTARAIKPAAIREGKILLAAIEAELRLKKKPHRR